MLKRTNVFIIVDIIQCICVTNHHVVPHKYAQIKKENVGKK